MIEVDDVNVVIFDLDLNDDDGRPHAAISESGWYILVPLNIMARVSTEYFFLFKIKFQKKKIRKFY